MDKTGKGKWDWVPDLMPGVANLVAEKRDLYGKEHVDLCWSKGMRGEPGWFFAREGAIAIGTPWVDPKMANFAATYITKGQALLVIMEPVGINGP